MKKDAPTDAQRAARRTHVMRTAEWVLSQAYRGATRQEMIDSQLRVRASVVREAERRVDRLTSPRNRSLPMS